MPTLQLPQAVILRAGFKTIEKVHPKYPKGRRELYEQPTTQYSVAIGFIVEGLRGKHTHIHICARLCYESDITNFSQTISVIGK